MSKAAVVGWMLVVLLAGVVIGLFIPQEPPKEPERPPLVDLRDKITTVYVNGTAAYAWRVAGDIEGGYTVDVSYGEPQVCPQPVDDNTIRSIGRELQRVIDANESNRVVPVFPRYQ